MKKLIKILTIIMTFFIMSKTCYAMKTKVEEIPNIKIHINTNNINETRKIYHIISEDNTNSFYSIELNNEDYSFYFDDYDYYGSMNYLSEELKHKIGLITYFGYGYRDRTDIKWYIITQYMIWEELIKEENGEIYFVDKNNNRIDLYQKEMQTITKDIESFDILPSFLESNVLESQYNLKLTETLSFKDNNNILKEYDIIHSDDISHKIENNKITITPLNINTAIIIFKRQTNESEYMKIYINSGHRLISRGDIDKPNTLMIINVSCPTIKIKGNIENNFSNQDNLYNIYFEDGNEYYRNITLNSNGLSEEISLYPGKYYLSQAKASYGYKLNQEKIAFEVSKEDQIIEFKNELATKHVTIEKLIIDNEEEIPASNTKLNIYTENKLYKEIITNSEGKSFIDLPYGTYTIIENNLSRESQKVYTIKIDENYNEEKSFIIKEEISNNELEEELPSINDKSEKELPKGNIIINKYDYLTNKPLSGIKIALFNQDKKLIKEEVTNNEGKIIFKDIETGTYYIKEILNDNNYELEEAIKIEVKEDIDTIITSNNRTMIEVPNTLATNPNIKIVLSTIFIISGSYLSLKKSKNEEI